MSDNTIHLPKRHPKLRRTFKIACIMLGILAVILLVGSVIGANPSDQSGVIPSTTLSTNTASPKSTDTAPKQNSIPPLPAAPQTVTVPSTNVPSQSEIDASLCNDTIKNTQAIVNSNNKMFFDGWDDWNKIYYGKYDSPEAQESKRWTKDYVKKLNDDVIRSNDPTMQSFCHTSSSLSSMLTIVNYDAW